MMKTLSEAIKSDEPEVALRMVFAAYSGLVDVTGEETLALIVLLNLTLKRVEVESLTSLPSAKALLQDDSHVSSCLQEVRWLHSHNVKYPDTRVQAQRLLCDTLLVNGEALGSAHCERRLGWSHNSSMVNKSKLFCAGFIWEGVSTCLAECVAHDQGAWRKAFRSFGVTKPQFDSWREFINKAMNTERFPTEVSDYSKQVRFPWCNDYLAITPVVSCAVQDQIQQLHTQRIGRFRTITHGHPASVGDLTSSKGGNVSVLNYPLFISQYKRRTLSQSRAGKVASGKPVFNVGAVLNKRFMGVLHSLTHLEKELTLRQRRRHRVALIRQLRRGLADWLLPIMEWRDSIQDDADNEIIATEPERSLLSAPLADNAKLLRLVNQRFHETLQSGGFSKSEYAYHPKLLEPVSNQLRWILNSLGNKNDAEETSSIEVIHLENLRVFDALSLANPYLVGIPSLTALWGFVHAYERKLKSLLDHRVGFTGVAWHIREYSAVSGLKLPGLTLERKRSDHLKRTGIIESTHCDVVMDLVIRVNPDCLAHESRDELVELVKAALPSRFAGGTLQPPSLYESKDWCSLRSSQSLYQRVSRLSAAGRWVCPSVTTPKSFEGLCELAELDKDLKPVMVGYQLLEEPTERPNSVSPVHAYAEPLIGLCVCKSPIDICLKGEKYFNAICFWKMDVVGGSILMRRA